MIIIVNGKLITVTGGIIDPGSLVIEDQKITALGKEIMPTSAIPPGAEVIDATGKWVLPGFIDAHSHVAIYGEPAVWANLDLNEMTGPNTAQLRALDAINPDDPALNDLIAAGITTVYTGPGSANIIGGTGVAIKPVGRTPEEMIIPGTEAMKIALGENPKRVYGEQKKQYPATRMGNAAFLRESLVAAQNYLIKITQAQQEAVAEHKDARLPDRDLKLEALGKLLRREMRARIHCHRKDDILTAIRIAEEFNLDFVIEHCTEGYKIADILAAKGVKATVGPLMLTREKMELNEVTLKNPGILAKAGVKIAIQVDGNSDTRWLPLHAGIAVREGLDEETALRAITINAAEILGISDRIGSLEEGKDADITIFSGNPFLTYTVCERTYINGKLVFQRQ